MSSVIRALMLMVALLAGASLAIQCPPEDTPAEGGPRRVILDLDGGGDDAWALVMLLSNEAQYNICVQAVTCSHGNARVSDVLVNVLRILDSMDRLDVPVYVGASEPLITPGPNRNTSHYFWGNNGFGDVEFDSPFAVDSLVSLHAVEAMNELFEKYPNQITLLAVGPLTNVALLYKMYPETRDKIGDLYILGGNRHGVGNTALAAEFNFFRDPEAAHIVLNNSPKIVRVFPWETVLLQTFTTRWRFETFKHTTNPAVELLNQVEYVVYAREEIWTPCDMYVAAIFLNSSILRTVKTYRAEVELTGRVTRGMMAILHHVKDSSQHNVAVIDEIDTEEVQRMLVALNHK
ncbi:pyrimidine-specific ribonucleoside hydrolase RihA-like [Anopheles merus]|uniref:Inosine/uridine-preferring nucleoside hydrolase domain-containing protein n=1 Tax=Anopheles merus TaxID=30066 RepID=A0A182VAU1_ANOME|nr:pyrimidine-specific ribonucleoside hydrolase RihA-like [Anopheles merus]XP_041766261.1 pyrimidine-specific ribonucleoside hydrolase RihA-like [Anopheles merus]